MTKYNIYIFKGIPVYRTSGLEVRKMSLRKCFNEVVTHSYDIKEMTVKDIFNAVGNKTVFYYLLCICK